MDERKKRILKRGFILFLLLISYLLFFRPVYGNDVESIRKSIARYDRIKRTDFEDIELIHVEDLALDEGEYRIVIYLDKNIDDAYENISNYNVAIFSKNQRNNYKFSNITTYQYHGEGYFQSSSFGRSSLPNDGKNRIATDDFHYEFIYSENPDLGEIRLEYDYAEAVNRQNEVIKITECPVFVYKKIIGTPEPRFRYFDADGNIIW